MRVNRSCTLLLSLVLVACTSAGEETNRAGGDSGITTSASDSGASEDDSDASETSWTDDAPSDAADAARADAGVAPSDAAAAEDAGEPLTAAGYLAILDFDYQGENGTPFAEDASIGYPTGVPDSYSWKYATTGTPDVPTAIAGRVTQTAGAAWLTVYQHTPGDSVALTNARVLLENFRVYYFSIASQAWQLVEDTPVGGAAFAEDFYENQATGADSRAEAAGISVRSGTYAAGGAGQPVANDPNSPVDGQPVGYNFHGFDSRFSVAWSDVQAIVVTVYMSCIPDSGDDPSDCMATPYVANVGLDSWASTTSAYGDCDPSNPWVCNGGVTGGRYKPVTTARQLFTAYAGPLGLLSTNLPPIPF